MTQVGMRSAGPAGATPLWAAVLAVVASADGNTEGYGTVENPALYGLAQQSPDPYFNDVKSGSNNDYNATDNGSYPAMTGYDMATGLGTPVASELALGMRAILDVVVSSCTDARKRNPDLHRIGRLRRLGDDPYGVTLNTSGVSCTQVDGSTPIGPTLPAGSDTLVTISCGGATLSGRNEAG